MLVLFTAIVVQTSFIISEKKIELSLTLFIALVIVAFIAGFISSIAGAGGIIVLPALLWAGLPPLNALATNKFQSVFGTLSSTINFFLKGHINLRALKSALCYAFIGSMLGTYLVHQISTDFLTLLMPYLLIVLALYMLFSPRLSSENIRKCFFPSYWRRYWDIWWFFWAGYRLVLCCCLCFVTWI